MVEEGFDSMIRTRVAGGLSWRPILLGTVLALGAGTEGCRTSQDLRRRTVDAASTLTDLQYRMVLNNLAMLSAHPHALPWYVRLKDGSVQVSDHGAFHANAFSYQYVFQDEWSTVRLGPSAGRATTMQWNVSPVTDPAELRALRAAYRKVLGLEHRADALKGVDVPAGDWFHVGEADVVPEEALYVGRYRDRCVWVTEDGVEALSNFTLAVLSIVPPKQSPPTPSIISPPVTAGGS